MGEYEYTELDSKSVLDSDGFYTDYTLYQCEDSEGNITYVCIFGDNELYTPDNSDPDFETEDEDEAYEWFESYGESDEDDIYECQDVKSSEENEECEDMKKNITSATEDKSLRNRLIDAVDTQLISFEEDIIPAIQKYVPEYDREWCAEDIQIPYENAREEFINLMVDDILLAYYEGE